MIASVRYLESPASTYKPYVGATYGYCIVMYIVFYSKTNLIIIGVSSLLLLLLCLLNHVQYADVRHRRDHPSEQEPIVQCLQLLGLGQLIGGAHLCRQEGYTCITNHILKQELYSYISGIIATHDTYII